MQRMTCAGKIIFVLFAFWKPAAGLMTIACAFNENLESYNWALISMFDVLGIAMSVDCERDMREMFLWYQKYQMSEKDCLARKCLV